MNSQKIIKIVKIVAFSIIILIIYTYTARPIYKYLTHYFISNDKRQLIPSYNLQDASLKQNFQKKNIKYNIPKNNLKQLIHPIHRYNKSKYKLANNYDFSDLFKIGKKVLDNPQNPRTALIILSKNQVDLNIKVISDISKIRKKENNITELLVVCEKPNTEEQTLIDFFINKDNSYKLQVAKYFNNLYSTNTPGFVSTNAKIYEHATFFFLYNNQFCYPYPMLLRGRLEGIVDPRRTLFWNWNEAIRDNFFRPIYKAKMIVTSHNHPMDHGFTDYASAEDFGTSFFSYSPYGIAVVGRTGVYMVRIKSQKALKKLQMHNFKDLVMSKINPLRKQYKKNNPDFLYDKNYRLEQRNLIFSIPEIKDALEDFFVENN